MIRIVLSLFFLLLVQKSYTQEIVGFHSTWDDELTQWLILGADEADDGELILIRDGRRPLWEVTFGGHQGEIRMVVEGRFEKWALRLGQAYVQIQRVWPGQNRDWRLTGSEYTMFFKGNHADFVTEWSGGLVKNTTFEVDMQYIRDPRDWLVRDSLTEEDELAYKLAMLFITAHVQFLP